MAAVVTYLKKKDRVSGNNKKSLKDDIINKVVLIPTKLFLYKFKYGILSTERFGSMVVRQGGWTEA